ncbi:hypothetical protein OS493_030085 [Desmophyllum pertusum]|uniref:Tubulin-specific chaperone E n=1 Tax=Desmophyllum pertusum TaxID=174260 RepID=A0A9W9ZBZ3_9CNID|nr:hypothetical protein OS493_030085 [Desmophyllum pertusum]
MADEIVGQRVLCEGFRGEIKYVGVVPPTSGEWYGIEWDEPDRGKHDGTNEGIKYFECRHPKSGSFVRPKKVDFGISVIEALKQQYGLGGDGINKEDMYVVSAGNKKKPVEMVGADSIQEKQSENVLRLPPVPEQLLSSFNTISVLYLNRMQIHWEEVEVVVSMMPSLKQLHVCHNCLNSLRGKDDQLCQLQGLQNIELLNLEGNQLSDWTTILRLGHLPRLNSLILNDNGLTGVELGNKVQDEQDGAPLFPALESLSLGNNRITEIQSINELNRLPSLTGLRFKGNPLFQAETTFESRQELLARLPSLSSLNGSPVNPKERETAERAHLKKYATSWINAGGNTAERENGGHRLKPEFVELHPRYEELIKAVTITCPDAPDKKSVTKKLPGTMTIGKIKGLLYRLFKVDSSDQKLSSVDTKLGREVELDDDLRQLTFYSVQSGDTLYLRW